MEYESRTKNQISSATTDSSNTSSDRDSSVPGNSNVYTNNGAIGLQQISYATVLPAKNINNEVTGINIIDNVATKVTDPQQETEGVDVDDVISNAGQIEEELTTIPSPRTAVTADTTLILDEQVNRYSGVHTQDHSGSQSISATIPMEATFSNTPVDSNLVTGQPSVESAVKCQPSIPHPYGYIGYLLMEYFPLGSIADNLKKFQRGENSKGLKTLHQLSQEIEEIESAMREKKRTDDEFGRFRHRWCTLKAEKEKVAAWCQHILRGVMKTVRRLHEMNLLHLDIKDHNFLLRKTCEHAKEFICECDLPSFDILMGDFDYTQELNSLILNPKSIGTRGYKAPHMESVNERAAQPCHDMYGSMVTIIRVACRMSQDHICMEILRFWEAMLLTTANMEAQLTELYDNLTLLLSYIKKLENANHFDNENHQCNCTCEFFKNEIAFCARKLVMPPQHRFQYELTNQMMQFGSDALIIGISGVFLTHGLSSLREDGVLLYMKQILTGTIEDCLQHT